MGHYEKLYHRIKNNPKDVYYDKLEKLLTKVGGFEAHKGKGDHMIFTHPDLVENLSVDTRGNTKPVKAVYVKKSLKLFDIVNPNFPWKGDK